jgi:hypothetical protein
VSFYSRWQPLVDEDRHTALVFGFLRHAPADLGLGPWLEEVLRRTVSAIALEPSSFWPNLPSVVVGSVSTVPELVFEADDGQPLNVIVEVKPGFGMHYIDQIAREATDVASSTGATRIAVVMVGADLGRPASTVSWDDEVAARLAAAGLDVRSELYYSSFAELGDVIRRVAAARPEWNAYATDVLHQLNERGLLGYEGAPMHDDLEGLTRRNAVELYNRIVLAARQFYLQLQGQRTFAELGLAPVVGQGYVAARMLRDGRSETVTQNAEWFESRIIVSRFQHESLPDTECVFIGFDLVGGASGEIEMLVGRCEGNFELYAFAAALPDEVRGAASTGLPFEATSGATRYIYDRRPWYPDDAAIDIEWVSTRAALAAGLTGAGGDESQP